MGFGAAARRRGLPTNDSFAGFSSFDERQPYAAELEQALSAPRERHLVMCHPGHPDAELAGPRSRRGAPAYGVRRPDVQPGADGAHLAAGAQRRRAALRLVAAGAAGMTLGQHDPGRPAPRCVTGWLFSICGFISLCVDGIILKLLTVFAGMHPFVARIIAISIAMVSGWLSHRTFTFALTTRPTLAEFLRYVAVGWFVSAINYGLFVVILLARPATEPLIALVASSLVAMVFAYFGMRFAAFRVDDGPTRE